MEARHPEHGKKTGYPFSASHIEVSFLEEISGGDPEKMVKYRDYLSIAENNMKFLESKGRPMPCPDCGCNTGPETKWFRLNDDGHEFLGVFDLCEYLLKKYKATWAILIVPLVTGYFLPHILAFFALKIG